MKKPEFVPELWREYIATGCYSYAMQWKTNEFALVGDSIGKRITGSEDDETLIEVLIEELNFLNYTIQEIETKEEAPDGYFKIYLMRNQAGNYHFFRQDLDGNWSHKYPDKLPVNVDHNGIVISNPDDVLDKLLDSGWCFLVGKK